MVDLVRVNAKEIDLKVSNQPNRIITFDYNLLILVVEHAYMVCPTTFIVKILK